MERPSSVREFASQEAGFLSSFQWFTAAVGATSGSLVCNPSHRRYCIRTGGRHAATACGVINTGGNMVVFVNALLVPFAAKMFGWPFVMSTGAMFVLIGAVCWLFIRPDRPAAD